MVPEVAAEDSSAKYSKHIWSAEAVRAAIIKSTKMIKLASTKDEVVVLVHDELLRFFSSYYTAAMKGNFLESQKDRFEVDLSGTGLESLATWIYTGKCVQHEDWTCYIYLYIFADQVDILALSRDILRWLSKSVAKLPDYNGVNLILRNVTQHSQLYIWMLNSHIAHWVPQDDDNDPCLLDSDKDPDNLLANFIYQVMKGIAVRDNSQNLDKRSDCSCCNEICQYHEHESKEEWEATCGQYKKSKMPASLS